MVTGCSGQGYVYDVVLEERMLSGRIRCCNPYSKSTKMHHKRNSQGAGIQLLMQNNAVYTLIPVLITLLWLPLALVTSLLGSFLDEVTIHFLPWRPSNLNRWCAHIREGNTQKKAGQQGQAARAFWGQTEASGTEYREVRPRPLPRGWNDPYSPLPASTSPWWAELSGWETGFAPERGTVWAGCWKLDAPDGHL